MNLCHLVVKRSFCNDGQPSSFLGHPIWPRKLQCDHILFGHGGCVNTIHWNEVGSLLVSGSDDRKVNLWSFAAVEPKLIRSLPTLHQHNIFDAKFRPYDENVVYTVGADGKVGSVDISESPNPQLLYSAYSGLASKIDFQPQSANIFLATFGDGGVRLFDVRKPRPSLGPVVFLDDGVTAVQFMPNHTSSLFAIGADDLFLRICDLRKGPQSDSDTPNTDAVVRMYTCPHLLDSVARQPRFSIRSKRSEVGISGVCWSQNASSIAVNYRGDDVILFNMHSYTPQAMATMNLEVDTSSVLHMFPGRVNVQTCAKEVNFCFADTHLCTGGDCGSIFIWDVHSGALRRKLHADRCVVNCVAPHPTLPLLASSGIDSEIKVWGAGDFVVPEQRDLPDDASRSVSRSWHQRMMENAPNVTTPEAKKHLAEAEALKLQGNAKVKAKQWAAALAVYKLAVKELHFIAPTAPLSVEQQALRRACQLNQAHCLLHMEQFREVRDVCTAILDSDPRNVKALYRRATSLGQLKEFGRALADVELALQLEPSAELQRLRHSLAQQQQQRRRRERDMYRTMFVGEAAHPAADAPGGQLVASDRVATDATDQEDEAMEVAEEYSGMYDVDVHVSVMEEEEDVVAQNGAGPEHDVPHYAITNTDNGELAVTIHLSTVEDVSTVDLTAGRAALRCRGPGFGALRVALDCAVDPTTAQAKWRPQLKMLHVILCQVEHMEL